ncbi:hypothetical protein MGN01_42840 [Methylobacterium gnaphalii]|uniref:Integrase catalytic domain-containing protein n=1 Tax=Methylobacterium gnaphalii TaxID=1010610 RepID=A0A512JR73_9HYPH|nr:hypothetical protein MGN01_42840 [Methylobacterium gnaphalii]GLS48867.1 hypothetical protein GCM10007885_17140 [Methylobacterium gnaphalii]
MGFALSWLHPLRSWRLREIWGGSLPTHLQLFLDDYNRARRLKTLRGLTPYEHVLHVWMKEPERFRLDPSHHMPGPYT